MPAEAIGSMWTSFHAALVGGGRWEVFDRVYGPVIRTWVFKYRVQEADAADLTQQVYLNLLKSMETYDKDRGAFRGWLHRVVRNEVLNHFRHRDRHPDGHAGGNSVVGELPGPAAADDLATGLSGLADERLEKLESLRAQCSPQTWDLVTAFHAGQSAKEVAAQYGTSVGAVHQAVYRVRNLARTLGMTQ